MWGATCLQGPGDRRGRAFQSTHPVWGATQVPRRGGAGRGFQSTHPVWGATSVVQPVIPPTAAFQSTHPVWGATYIGSCPILFVVISIHAPRVGCDLAGQIEIDSEVHFNPRTPCGVRLLQAINGVLLVNFNPRTPCGVRRPPRFDTGREMRISIHAPRVGCDVLQVFFKLRSVISIHAPRVGCDREPSALSLR